MPTKNPRRVPQETAATPEEIGAAIAALTTADLARLKLYAKNRIDKLGPKADRRTEDDLFQIAIDSLLGDTRRWNKDKVGIAVFLAGAIRSISSNWAKTYKPEETLLLETELLKTNPDGGLFNPAFQKVTDGRADPEQHLIDEEKRRADEQLLRNIEHIFRDDEKAQMLLEALDEGYDPPGIRAFWGWSQDEYNATILRLRRTLKRAGLTINAAGGKDNVQ